MPSFSPKCVAGKTTCAERILFLAGRIRSKGEVHHGTAAFDFHPIEQKKGITIKAAATTLAWKKHAFNPVMKSTAYAHGTAHHCFTESPDGKEIFIVYHRHSTLQKTEPRALSIDRVRFVPDPAGGPDILQIHGPTSSPQPLPSGAKR